ncbi:hypothetical protein BKP45_20000 [Anaerobacillus alkalidiazotrophicus]|uniref:Flagellar protein n=1 Tax=Anaerobacillus alkalidiazotrophicus TaxID=472963 RepID=A0A1S2LZN1_9BACI|nr:flagellar biosynthetic protein FliO [Anaerobacillus alkalidiazotrophicus]OIJ17846.1 hypothetical protein BKP45_20000 [Anaerobacillus alkalidiazotrophicus]
MDKKWGPLYYFKFFVSFVFAIILFASLEVSFVQAEQEDNRSVLDGFKDVQEQPLSEETAKENEQIGAKEEPVISNADDILQDQSLFGMFFQLFLALAVIIFMIYALIKFIGKRTQSYQNHRTLQNIGGVPVGTNRSIQLIRVGERILVVGIGESIQLLKEIDNETEVKKIIEDYEIKENPEQLSSVFQLIQTKLKRENVNNNHSKIQFKSLLERQLNDVKNAQKQVHTTIKEKEHL